MNYEYHVALSFAREKREYVERVAVHLRKNEVAVFYDYDQKIEMWGNNLCEYLGRIFSEASEYVVMFISREYVKKEWPSHERQHALSRSIKEKREYILPVRFDDVTIPGLSNDVVYLNASDYTPESLADAIANKIKRQSDSQIPSVPVKSFREPNYPFREPNYNEQKPDDMKTIWLDVLSDKVTSGAIIEQGGIDPHGVTEQYKVSRGMTIKVKKSVAQKLFDVQSDTAPDYRVRSLFLTEPTHFGACVNTTHVQERECIDNAYAEYPTEKAYSIYSRFHSEHEYEHVKSCFELFIHLYTRHSFQQSIPSKFTYPEQGVDIHYSTETIFVAVQTHPINDRNEQLVSTCENPDSWTVLAIFDSTGTHPNKEEGYSDHPFFRGDWHGWSRLDKLLGIWYFSSICFSDLSRTKTKLLANPHHSDDAVTHLLRWFRTPKPPVLNFTA